MDFNNNQAIYLQIADYVCDKIQLEDYKEEEKIPSVRELAVALEVNPNTVMRAYDYLQQQDIIFTKRGMGFFVQTNSAAKILEMRKETFLKEELPELFKKMQMLKIDFSDLENQYKKHNKL
jgi:DNA-binding transcriptional regulator YhcF (GntR family)